MKTVELDAYVLETLMPDLVGHDRAPSALLVFLFLWIQTRGAGVASIQLSLVDIAIGTGLSKRAVQDALARLLKRKLISIQRDGITAVPVYAVKRPWVR
ncbi:MAG: helix-turn-helix domain-containing protein [Gemmatimonadaceae bacterium]